MFIHIFAGAVLGGVLASGLLGPLGAGPAQLLFVLLVVVHPQLTARIPSSASSQQHPHTPPHNMAQAALDPAPQAPGIGPG